MCYLCMPCGHSNHLWTAFQNMFFFSCQPVSLMDPTYHMEHKASLLHKAPFTLQKVNPAGVGFNLDSF